ncbi:MAG TPA: EAL domain-containing protein [Actinomycetes bacterium]|nr:EAL domain-containing protein [Actinomycetes bacterium]
MRDGQAAAMRAAEDAVQAADPWLAAVRAAVAEPSIPDLHAQPIVDLARGEVAGYEVLARFPGPPQAAPDEWFAVADRAGLAAYLEARVLDRALQLRSSLPRGAFLSVNVSTHLLASEPVQQVLARAGSLAGTVLELTEPVPEQRPDLTNALCSVTAVGGRIAIDDAGAGHHGMRQMATVRPALVKLDRSLVGGIDTDPTKAAVVEMLGDFANRLDARLLAEGIETEAELRTLVGLGVPLGQGFLLARPDLPWVGLTEAVIALLRSEAHAGRDGHVAELVEDADVVGAGSGEAPQTGQIIVEVDRGEHPVAMRHATGGQLHRTTGPALLMVLPSDRIEHVAHTALARSSPHRFEPLVCVDIAGRLVGVVRMERLVSALAARASDPLSAPGHS